MPELSEIGTAPRSLLTKVRLAEVAGRQWGVVTRRQLEAEGVAKGEMSRWIKEGRVHRVHPGVYAVGHSSLAIEGRLAAALLYAGPGAALWGVTGGYWVGMVQAQPRTLHVCTSRQLRSLRDVKVHTRKSIDRVWHRGFPVTPPAQTLLDMASQIPTKQLRNVLSNADYLRLVTLDEVRAVLGRGKPGAAKLRLVLERHEPQLARTRSELEVEFLRLRERYSLTPPDGVNVFVAGWEVDVVWYEQKVIVELDGHAGHSNPAAIERDRRRDLDLRAAGFTVLRYTWQQITQTPELVAADLRRALCRRGAAR